MGGRDKDSEAPTETNRPTSVCIVLTDKADLPMQMQQEDEIEVLTSIRQRS